MNVTQRVLNASKQMATAIVGMETNEAVTAIAVLAGSVLYSEGKDKSPGECRVLFESHIAQVQMAIAANMQHELRNPTRPKLILPAR